MLALSIDTLASSYSFSHGPLLHDEVFWSENCVRALVAPKKCLFQFWCYTYKNAALACHVMEIIAMLHRKRTLTATCTSSRGEIHDFLSHSSVTTHCGVHQNILRYNGVLSAISLDRAETLNISRLLRSRFRTLLNELCWLRYGKFCVAFSEILWYVRPHCAAHQLRNISMPVYNDVALY